MSHPPAHHDHSGWQQRELHRKHPSHKTSAADEIGHWVRTVGVLAPLIIGEFVKDPEQKWRFVRITSVAVAILSEGLHFTHVHRARERDREALEACAMPTAAAL